MGAVGGFIKVMVGLFIIGASFIFTQPLFDFLYAVGITMGGNAAHTAVFIDKSLLVLPVLFGLAIFLWGFIDVTRTEGR